MRYAVVTFIFSDYEILREPLVCDKNAEYYCLTDNKNLSSKTWKCIYVEEFDIKNLTGVQKTYMCKYSFHKYIPSHFDYFITIDGSIEIVDNLSPIVNNMIDNGYDIGLSIHSWRDTFVDEYDTWIKYRRLPRHYKDIFVDYSKINGINPNEHTGLIECTMKIYKNDSSVLQFIDDIYDVLKLNNNFMDANDQCYFTCVFKKYVDRLKSVYFCRCLYGNSKYFNMYNHKTWIKVPTPIAVDKTLNKIFGCVVNIETF